MGVRKNHVKKTITSPYPIFFFINIFFYDDVVDDKMVTVAIVPLKISSCQECPHRVTWELVMEKHYCNAMKGKTFKDKLIVQDWCPYKEEE